MPKEIIESPDVFPLRKYKNLDPPNGIPINMAVKTKGAVMYNKVVPVNQQGESVAPDDCLAQTRQVLENLAAMVKAAGAEMTDIRRSYAASSSRNRIPRAWSWRLAGWRSRSGRSNSSRWFRCQTEPSVRHRSRPGKTDRLEDPETASHCRTPDRL